MAYVAGYQFDVFISYCNVDNEPIGSRRGWVEEFHEALEDWLVKRRGLKNLKIWRDPELKGNTRFDEAIRHRTQSSALLFVLQSRNYAQSEYCRKELAWFHEFNCSQPAGLTVDEESRIFNILLNNVPRNNWPRELSGTAVFPLHYAKGK